MLGWYELSYAESIFYDSLTMLVLIATDGVNTGVSQRSELELHQGAI